MIEELNEENKAAGKLFMAEQRNMTKCRTYKTVTGQENWCSLLALNMEDKQTLNQDVVHEPKSTTTIEELLDGYTTWEKLSKGNEYNCQTCRYLKEADRQTTVVFAPPILAMQLKRFSKDDGTGGTEAKKLTDTVKFQENLSLEYKLLPLAQKKNATASMQ